MAQQIVTPPETSADVLGEDGPFVRLLPGFSPRAGQQDMAMRIEDALAHNSVFVGESGTGTGKTFAYLVPALKSGKRILISSGTKNLQDQIFNRDLPLVRDALGTPIAATLLKGRANYVCLYRLACARESGSMDGDGDASDILRVARWADATRYGDIAEVTDVSEDSGIWPMVTSTADNCLGSACSYYDDCFVNRARREVLDAEIVVINHHLFFADLALREEGFGQLLPGMDAVIFDEAHQLPEIASTFFGVILSSHQLLNLCRDTIAEDLREQSGIPDLQERAHRVEKATADFRLAFGRASRREAWHVVVGEDAIQRTLADLKALLSELAVALEVAAGKGQGLANCGRRAVDLLERLYTISESPPPEYVAWFETSGRGVSLHLTALDVATPFRQHVEDGDRAWIFTSATLTVGQRFDHYQAQMGLEVADTYRWESPYDYAGQALMYIPTGMPNPANPDYTKKVIEAALPVLTASRGRTFMLFTSYRALHIATDLLASKISYPLFVQGNAPRSVLLERFRAAGNAVLLGTSSFWEGVDVRGDALSCVIIDKLPFASPDDPVLRARGEAMEQVGRNPFLEYQLPNAVIALNQGAGRLIRDENDRGVLMLCDPRLLSKGYGKSFLASLPPMPLTQDLAEVESFFANENDRPPTT
ncbi:MAG: ATP-dependent DNA helicase [Gammaproteobacteria bacterium]|nr:ATP-dependent DNA helicase [Gammaproteobacteria bacterium]